MQWFGFAAAILSVSSLNLIALGITFLEIINHKIGFLKNMFFWGWKYKYCQVWKHMRFSIFCYKYFYGSSFGPKQQISKFWQNLRQWCGICRELCLNGGLRKQSLNVLVLIKLHQHHTKLTLTDLNSVGRTCCCTRIRPTPIWQHLHHPKLN